MHIAHEKLQGLDREGIIALVEPILRAHGVQAVEFVWAGRSGESVLSLTIERPEAKLAGEGITLDLCSEISRDISSALDVTDLIPGRFRLEVGSPGIERKLYEAAEYVRFEGQSAKLKLRVPVEGQYTFRGQLGGLDEAGNVLIHTDAGELHLEFANIQSGHLVFDWKVAKPGRSANPSKSGAGKNGRKARQRSR
ncbi:MAG: ribosome maturation factor RimP [Myxococcales bacterium]|nr:ribosome maturation factor RimP [Myxococcales bacterium]